MKPRLETRPRPNVLRAARRLLGATVAVITGACLLVAPSTPNIHGNTLAVVAGACAAGVLAAVRR